MKKGRKKSVQAIILAGGKGTRLRPLTLSTPKPVVSLANRPFLTCRLEMPRCAGISLDLCSVLGGHTFPGDRAHLPEYRRIGGVDSGSLP